RWYLYYIDEDGKFRTRRINAFEAFHYKGKKTHRYRVVCPECGGLSLVIVKSLKGNQNCPHCDCIISLDDLDDDVVDAIEEDEL
ncbi:MAG: hypothetical protein ACREAO_00080, partial [Nitrososphaera sp.]